MNKNDVTLQVWQLWPQALAGPVVTLVLLLVSALLVVTGTVAESGIPFLAAFSCFAGALAGGFRAAKRKQSATLLVGLAVGLLLFLLYFLLGVLFSFAVAPSPHTPQVLLGSLTGGLCGGFLAGMKKSKIKR